MQVMSVWDRGRAAQIAFCVKKDKKKLHEKRRQRGVNTNETQDERDEGEKKYR